MRAFLGFLAALAVAALIGAALAYPAYEITRHFASWPFHRVANRVTMLMLVVVLFRVCRRAGLTRARDFGYGLPWRRFLGVSLAFGLVGIVTAAIGAWFLLAAHLRAWADPAALKSVGVWIHWILSGLASGIAVALIEETVMRGGLHTAITRESGAATAALLTAPLFALLHFFARRTIPPDAVSAGSGFVLLGTFFSPWAHPALIVDAFLAWLAVGLLLSLTRIWTGNIAAAVGLHAGWVLVLRVLQQGTVPGPGRAYAAWVGSFDGLLGYWLLPWAVAIGLLLALTRRRWAPQARSSEASAVAMASSLASGSSSSR